MEDEILKVILVQVNDQSLNKQTEIVKMHDEN